MSAEDRTPEDVRREIERTREQLADTAAALAEKADVKKQVRGRVDEVKADVREKVETVKEKVTPSGNGTAGTAEPGADEGVAARAQAAAAAAAGTTAESVKANPIPWAAVAAGLLGFSLGYLIAGRRTP